MDRFSMGTRGPSLNKKKKKEGSTKKGGLLKIATLRKAQAENDSEREICNGDKEGTDWACRISTRRAPAFGNTGRGGGNEEK